MRGARGKATAGLALLALAAAVGCSDPGPNPDDPGSVALQLFALAGGEPGREPLEGFFDPDLLSNHRVSLLDALDTIAGSAPPELLGVLAAPGAEEAFVDLAVPLPGGGRALYSVQLRRPGEVGWRITWFQGPGVEWPPRPRPAESLSTSAPPGPPDDDW